MAYGSRFFFLITLFGHNTTYNHANASLRRFYKDLLMINLPQMNMPIITNTNPFCLQIFNHILFLPCLKIEIDVLVDLRQVRVVCIPVDDGEFVFVQEAGVCAFVLEECFHCWGEVVAVDRVHAGGEDVQAGDCAEGGGFEGVDCCFLVGVGGVSVVLDVVRYPGEGVVVLFRDHLVVRGAEMCRNCDEENDDA